MTSKRNRIHPNTIKTISTGLNPQSSYVSIVFEIEMSTEIQRKVGRMLLLDFKTLATFSATAQGSVVKIGSVTSSSWSKFGRLF